MAKTLPRELEPTPEDRALGTILTPAAVVDLDRLATNLDRMGAYAAEHRLRLRPHIKTHKTPWIAAEQVRKGAVGVSVATPREALVMARAVDDVLVAYPTVDPARTRLVAEVAGQVRVTVALDSETAIRRLSDALLDEGTEAGVLVELDLGSRRCGVTTPERALALARTASETPAVTYRGVLFYPGHMRMPPSEMDDAIVAINRELATFLDVLDAAGLPAEVVSGGSTPTWSRSHEMADVTELRPGTYVYNDRNTVGIDACRWDDCAYTILATVISTAVPGQAVLDAGTKALSGDPVRAPGFRGYGSLLDRREVEVVRKTEEHGILDLSETDWRPAVGDRVRIVPNHACVSVNLQPKVYGVRGDRVVASWPVLPRGWDVG